MKIRRPNAGFPHPGPVDVWLISILCEVFPVHRRVFNIIPGSRLMASESRVWEAGSPPIRPLGLRDSIDPQGPPDSEVLGGCTH